MPWIKRNLAVVISAAVALGLIGFGVWYLMGAMAKNKSMDDEIGNLKSEINRLSTAQFYPSPTNITIAQAEVKRMNEFMEQAKKFFPTSAPSGPLNNQTFAALLHNTVDDLAKQALAAGIRVETNYHFSFETQWLPVSFPPASLKPLSDRLAEVKQIASILFASKVNRLEIIRRARVVDEVPGPTAGDDYLNDVPYTSAETGMTMWPYEIVFHSFSPELAATLESIAKMPEAYVVRSIVVNPADALQPPAAAPPPGAPQGRQPGRPGGQRPGAGAPPTTLETIQNERLLRVVLRLEVIKPSDAPPGGPGMRRGMPGPPGGTQ